MIKNIFDISDFVPAQSLTGTVYELVKREKVARKAKKLTQRQLAERTGVSYGSIRRFEQTGEISLLSLVKIANALDCLEDFNELFKKAAREPYYEGILDVTEEELVSIDFRGNSHSCIVDLKLTDVVDGDLIKVVAWYDNEWGYSNRLVELTADFGKME